MSLVYAGARLSERRRLKGDSKVWRQPAAGSVHKLVTSLVPSAVKEAAGLTRLPSAAPSGCCHHNYSAASDTTCLW